MSGSKGGKAPVRSRSGGYQPRQTANTLATELRRSDAGYQPTTSQGSSKPPASVPNQPSSVQPPKK